ncbi:hypothetical protein B4N84_16320 [Flavobacterium sp. IR1]|nr:hypothetical protein B4N84_16320 [Flavobacterium sp. IR1]
MNRILNISIFVLLIFTNCNNEKKISDKKVDTKISKQVLKDTDDKLEAKYWCFYKISENSFSENHKLSKEEIINKFKNIKIAIDEKMLTVVNQCAFEYYKSTKSLIKYFKSNKTVELYKSIFSQNGIKIENDINVYQALNPEKKCEIPWDEVIVINEVLVVVFDDYLLFFKNEKVESKNECYSNAKITDLPITNKIIDGNDVWNQLDCDIADLESQDYLRLPDIDQVQVFIIGNFNYDDFIYNLVTIKDGKVVLKKKIGFAIAESENSISEITEFQVNKNYVFLITTKVKENGVFEKTKLEKFIINESGEIFTVN